MAKKGGIEVISKYAQFCYESDMPQGVADDTVFSQIDLNLSIADGKVVILHKAEFYMSAAALVNLLTAGEWYAFAVTSSEEVADFFLSQRNLYGSYVHFVTTTLAADTEVVMPFVIDWTDLPMGGRVVTPDSLYFGFDTNGSAAAYNCSAHLYYSVATVPAPESISMIAPFIPRAL